MSEDQFEKLAQLIKGAHDDLSERMEEGFGQVDERFTKIDERFDRLETKMDHEFAHVHAELRDIHGRLDVIEERVGLQSGYAKEIDDLRARVAFLERRLDVKSVV